MDQFSDGCHLIIFLFLHSLFAAGLLNTNPNRSITLDANIKLFDINTRISEILMNQELFNKHHNKINVIMGIPITKSEDIGLNSYKKIKTYMENISESMVDDNFENIEYYKQLGKAYVKLAHFLRTKNMENVQGEFITFVLRSMKMNSVEGRQLFPCVLMQSKLGTECKAIFMEEVSKTFLKQFLLNSII